MDGNFKCDGCDLVFKDKQKLNIHKLMVHVGTMNKTCYICNKQYSTNKMYQKHLSKYHEESNDLVDEESKNKQTKNKHSQSEHSQSEESTVSQKKQDSSSSSESNSSSEPNSNSMSRSGSIFKSDEYSSDDSSSESVVSLKTIKHEEKTSARTRPQKRSQKRIIRIVKNEKNEGRTKPEKNEEKKFTRTKQRKIKKTDDDGNKVYKCPQCSSTFSAKKMLELHVGYHDNPSIVCTKCNRSFTKKENYDIHFKNIHSK